MGLSSKYRSGTILRSESRGKKVHSSRKRKCTDFLTFHFDEIPAYEIETITARCGEIDLPTLERQTKDFLRIYGRDVEFVNTGNNCHDVITLNNLLKENLPEVRGIELVNPSSGMAEEKQEFVAYKEISNEDFPIMTIFLLPIRIVECVDKRLRDILIDFFAFLEWKSPFLSPKNSMDMCYCIGCEGDYELDEDFKERNDEDYIKEAERYVSGDINDVFEEIQNKRRNQYGEYIDLCQQLEIKINEYLAKGRKWYKTPLGKRKQTRELFEVIKNGIALTLEDSLFNYDLRYLRYKYDDESFYEYVDTDEIFEFERQFIFSWGLEDDDVTEYLMEIVNADVCNISSTVLMNTARIAKCASPVEFSDYPKRWYNWYTKLLDYIYE